MNCIFTSCINEMHKMNRLLVLICATPLVSAAPHLVLSYYNEPREEVVQSISRIQNALGTPLDVFMYCKNETCPDIEGAHTQILENVGREGETYLRHIIAHHADFPEFAVFTQAVPNYLSERMGDLESFNSSSMSFMSFGSKGTCDCDNMGRQVGGGPRGGRAAPQAPPASP